VKKRRYGRSKFHGGEVRSRGMDVLRPGSSRHKG